MMNLNSLQKITWGGFTIMALFAIMLIPNTPEAYAEITCTNAIISGTIDDPVQIEESIQVTADSWCQIEYIILKGNVIIGADGSVDIFNSEIDGSVNDFSPTTPNTEAYLSQPTFVKGNFDVGGVSIVEGVGDGSTTVEGNLKSNGDGFIRAWDAVVKGNLSAKFKEVVDFIGNMVDGNLLIHNNDDASINVESNEISSNFELNSN